MPNSRLQVNLIFDGRVVEHWRYYPEENCWRDEIGAYCIPTSELISNDITGAIDHFISIIDGTHG